MAFGSALLTAVDFDKFGLSERAGVAIDIQIERLLKFFHRGAGERS